jgi:aminoglycoside 3-N-acetyltransferase
MGLSPHIEMLIRRLYRSPFIFKLLSRNKKPKASQNYSDVDFEKVIQYLKKIGIKKGDILIVHSAFRPLKGAHLSPKDIVNKLIDLVGNTGTLVMPVIRKYSESPSEKEALTASIDHINFTYDVKNSKVWTGIIAKTLMGFENAVTSRFPINTITAIGKHSLEMTKNNLDGDLPAANDENSPWYYCTLNNAWVISLGTDLAHSLTMIHTAEDVNRKKWPIKNWYREKKFTIIDGDFKTEKVVLERKPNWGMLHFGERTLSKDLIRANIMDSKIIEGVLIESLKSAELFSFLNSKNTNGYPYFWVSKYLEDKK